MTKGQRETGGDIEQGEGVIVRGKKKIRNKKGKKQKQKRKK